MHIASELFHIDTKSMDFFIGPRMVIGHFLHFVNHTRKMLSKYAESKMPYGYIFPGHPLLKFWVDS